MDICIENQQDQLVDQNQNNKVQIFIKKAIQKEVQKNSKRLANQKRKNYQNYICSIQDKSCEILNPKQTIQICTGLFLSEEGAIRFCYSVSQFCFGYSQDITKFIQINKALGIVEIVGEQKSYAKVYSVEEALQHIFYIPSIHIHSIAEKMIQFRNYHLTIRDYLKNINLSQEFLDEKEEQFFQFKEKCMEVLQQIQVQQPHLMYQYAFGRYSYIKQDYEFCHRGFSLSYLSLLGIDANIFSQIFLRGQRIDLTQSIDDIFDLSYQGLNSITNQTQNDSFECKIKTFDGFTIKIVQHKRDIQIPSFQTVFMPGINNFTFGFTELDVDLEELQKLIEYRQNILYKKNKLSLDDYINKELSFQFEDVEYSILSQQFLENFYQENLVEMMNAKKFKEEKQCGYKFIKH